MLSCPCFSSFVFSIETSLSGKNPASLFLSSCSLPPHCRPSLLKGAFGVFDTFLMWRFPLLSISIKSSGGTLPQQSEGWIVGPGTEPPSQLPSLGAWGICFCDSSLLAVIYINSWTCDVGDSLTSKDATGSALSSPRAPVARREPAAMGKGRDFLQPSGEQERSSGLQLLWGRKRAWVEM